MLFPFSFQNRTSKTAPPPVFAPKDDWNKESTDNNNNDHDNNGAATTTTSDDDKDTRSEVVNKPLSVEEATATATAIPKWLQVSFGSTTSTDDSFDYCWFGDCTKGRLK